MRIRHSLTHIPGLPVFRDEKVVKPEDAEMNSILTKEILKTLTQNQFFRYHSKSQGTVQVSLSICPSLLKLFIRKSSEKSIPTPEIISVDKEPNKSSKTSEKSRKFYFFQVKTTSKQYIFSTEVKTTRKIFIRGLRCIISLSQEFMSSMVLKKYCESVIKIQNNDSAMKTLHRSCRGIVSKQKKFQLKVEEIEKEVILAVIHSIITQIEIDEKCEECNNHELSFKNNLSEFKSLNIKQEQLKENIRRKTEKIRKIELKVFDLQEKVKNFYEKLGITNFGVVTFNIWTRVLEFLNTSEICILLSVNRKMRSLVKRGLLFKPLWRVLSLAGLEPRGLVYRIFMNNFYKTRIQGDGFEINQDVLFEIHSDVWNGLSQFQIETEEVLIELCRYNPSLEYCQGMHFVSNFLFSVFRDTREVLKTMDALCRPPFYLSELWKNDFCRLRLGIYQLEFLMKIRLPLLYKHLKKMEIPLDMIVSSWFLTVFTHFYFQFDVERESIEDIWDFFLVRGWGALISTGLALFYLNERSVLEQGYDETLMILTSKISCRGIGKVIPRFDVDQRVLEDLDSSQASFY